MDTDSDIGLKAHALAMFNRLYVTSNRPGRLVGLGGCDAMFNRLYVTSNRPGRLVGLGGCDDTVDALPLQFVPLAALLPRPDSNRACEASSASSPSWDLSDASSGAAGKRLRTLLT